MTPPPKPTLKPTPVAAAQSVRSGVERAAAALPPGVSGHIPRLRLRVPQGAGPEEIAQAMRSALSRARRDGEGGA